MSDIIEGTVTGSEVAIQAEPMAIMPHPTEFKRKLEGVYEAAFADLERRVAEFEPDLTTDKGRKAIASLAYEVSQQKVEMTKKSDLLVEDQKKIIKAVAEVRKEMEDKAAALRDKARAPLTEWEAVTKRQEAEAAKLRGMLSSIRMQAIGGVNVIDMDSGRLAQCLDSVKKIDLSADAVGEDAVETLQQYHLAACSELESMILAAKRSEAEQAELEELRAMKAAKEAEDAARLDAERQAAELERSKREHKERAEREIKRLTGWGDWVVDGTPITDASSDQLMSQIFKLDHGGFPDDHFGEHAGRVKSAAQSAKDGITNMLEAARQSEEKAAAEAEAKRIEQARAEAKAEAVREAAEKEATAKRIEAAEAERRAKDKENRAAVNRAILEGCKKYALEKGMPFDVEVAKTVIRAAASGSAGNLWVKY